MKINISKAEDIQYYMNKLQKDEQNPDIIRSDKYDEERLTNFVQVNQIIKWIDNLRKSNNMWRYSVDECFGMLEDAITSDSRFSDEDSLNKGYEVNQK